MVSKDNRQAPGGRRNPASMIETRAPTPACAEMFSDVAEPTMFPAEAAVVAGAAPERRLEFATVRHCARRALRQIGMPATPILPDADRVPRWPAGVVGSMTHCAGYRAAAVARSDEVRGIGIDAEPHAPLADEARDLVLRPEERMRLRALAQAESGLHWDRITFCVKEAVYKVWFPLTRQWLGFDDVSTTVYPDGTFEARLLIGDAPVAGVDWESLAGRWMTDRGFVAAATSVGP